MTGGTVTQHWHSGGTARRRSLAFRWQFEFNLSPSRGLRAAFRVHELELESSFPNLRLTESLTHTQLVLDSEVTGHCRGAARRRYASAGHSPGHTVLRLRSDSKLRLESRPSRTATAPTRNPNHVSAARASESGTTSTVKVSAPKRHPSVMILSMQVPESGPPSRRLR